MEYQHKYIIITLVVITILVIVNYFCYSTDKLEGFTTENIVAKKITSDNIVCNNNIVTKNMYAKGDLVVDENLFVNGNIYLKEGNTIDIGGIGMTNIIGHYAVFNPPNGNIILLGRPDGLIFKKGGGSFSGLPVDWNKVALTRNRPQVPDILA